MTTSSSIISYSNDTNVVSEEDRKSTQQDSSSPEKDSTSSSSAPPTMTTPSSQIRTTAPIQQPYRWWFHPFKSWLDIIISTLAPYVLKFHSIAATEPIPNETTIQVCQTFREKYHKQELQSAATQIKEWSQGIQCPIAEWVLPIPRRPNVLQEWNIVTKGDDDDVWLQNNIIPSMPTEDIEVHIFFPTSLLQPKYNNRLEVPLEDNEIGAKEIKVTSPEFSPITFLQELSLDVPLVLCFHSGGLNIGLSRDQTLLHLIKSISTQFDLKPMVMVSVEYSLVPERPFPIAPMEALTVTSHLLEQLPPQRQLHLAGASSGAYLAMITCLELLRQTNDHPKQRLASVLCAAPMLDPMADSSSYCMNSTSSMIDPSWFRWCWRSYLRLPSTPNNNTHPDTRTSATTDTATMTWDEVCGQNSNRAMYLASRWPQSQLERLTRPIVDVPPIPADLPLRVIVTTNRADPLEQDAIVFLEQWKAVSHPDARIIHLAHNGSHWLGTRVDKKAYTELIETWGAALFNESS